MRAIPINIAGVFAFLSGPEEASAAALRRTRALTWAAGLVLVAACGLALVPARPVRPCCQGKTARLPGPSRLSLPAGRRLDRGQRPDSGCEQAGEPADM